VTALDCAVAPGGAPARFQVTVSNPTGRTYERASLTFSYGYSTWGEEPGAFRLEYRHGGTWTRLPMHWIDPEEPELLASGAMHVDLPPHSTRTYDVRFGLPSGYTPEAGIVSFGGSVSLDLPGRAEQQSVSSVRGPVFALDPPSGTPVNFTLPEAAKQGGAPVAFTAHVDNRTGRAFDRAALDLTIDGVDVDRTVLDVFRDGGWRPVVLRTSVDHVVGTIADGFAVPAGYQRSYRLRVALRPGAMLTGGSQLRVTLRLRDADGADNATGADLGTAERLLHVVPPTVRARLPEEIRFPGAAEFPVHLENATGVALPPVHVRLTITNPPARDGLTVRYRPAGTSRWIVLPLRPNTDAPHSFLADLPAPRTDATPAGLRASYDVRVELTKWDTENANLLHIAAVLTLADGSPVSVSTASDPANAYVGVDWD
jgi:hypothetical protein